METAEPSAGGTILQQTLQSVLDGRCTAGRLWPVLEEALEELAEMRSIFRTSASGLPGPVRERCTDEIVAVEYSLDEYERTLGALNTALCESNMAALAREAGAARDIADQVNLNFLQFRDRVLRSGGPTSHGGINHLLALMKRIGAGEERARELECEVERQKEDAAAAIERLGTESAFPLPETRSFYERYAEILARFDGVFAPDAAPADVPPLEGEPETPVSSSGAAPEEWDGSLSKERLALLRELGGELEALGREFEKVDICAQARSFAEGPTSIPFVNVLVRASGLAADGRASAEVMTYYVGEFEEILAQYVTRHRELMKFESRSASLMETGERITGLFTELGELLAEGRSLWTSAVEAEQAEGAQVEDAQGGESSGEGAEGGLEERARVPGDADAPPGEETRSGLEPAAAEAWQARLVDAATRLDAATRELQILTEQESAVTCIRCGLRAAVGETTCRNCKAVLPTAGLDAPSFVDMLLLDKDAGAPAEEARMTANVQRLFDSACGLMEGTVSAEEFALVLDEMERLHALSQRAGRRALPASAEEISGEGSIEEASEIYRRGLELFGAGLSRLRTFAARPSSEGFQEAQALIWEGASSLQRVQRLLEPYVRNAGT